MMIQNDTENIYSLFWTCIFGESYKLQVQNITLTSNGLYQLIDVINLRSYNVEFNKLFYLETVSSDVLNYTLYYAQSRYLWSDFILAIYQKGISTDIITVAYLDPYGYDYQSLQIQYLNDSIMLQFYNQHKGSQIYDIFLGVYNISILLNANTVCEIIQKNQRVTIPISGGFQFENINPNVQFVLSSIDFAEKYVLMNAFIVCLTNPDSQLIRLKVMDATQLIIWVDKQKIDKYSRDQIQNINNITITAQNVLSSSYINLKVNNSWITLLQNEKDEKSNTFHAWLYIII